MHEQNKQERKNYVLPEGNWLTIKHNASQRKQAIPLFASIQHISKLKRYTNKNEGENPSENWWKPKLQSKRRNKNPEQYDGYTRIHM